ncbi:MAG: transporter substrate-binding domain-containing protein [Hydrogenophaga sp.]|nr:transporter substrate-binding domain-containing protein [Hydrogenophaga sp.]
MSPKTPHSPTPRRGLAALAAAAVAVVTFATLAAGANTAPAPATLRVGIDPSTLPVSTGERDYTNGAFETVYAHELAQRLGATLTLVPLPHAAQDQALQAGEVDLVLTRAAGNASGRSLATGYRSGLGVSMRSDTPVRHWQDLKGRVVCTSADNVQAQEQAVRLGAQLQLHAAPAQALVQVRMGGCDAAVLDHAQLGPLLARKEWTKFTAALPATEAAPLVARVAPAREALQAHLQRAVNALDDPALWAQRHQTWASNVAFEVYYDQTGPDCH